MPARIISALSCFLTIILFWITGNAVCWPASKVPILAGIMPVTSLSGMNRMAELSGGTCFPARLLKALKRAGSNPDAIQEVGIQYASSQCAELLDSDVDGIHFYTLNQSRGNAGDLQESGTEGFPAAFGTWRR